MNDTKAVVRKPVIPSITDLYSESEFRGKENALNVLLNQQPKAEWVKEHPFAKGVKYIPIERVEYLLTRIFIRWRVEVKEIGILANSAMCIVRLHYVHPVTGEWEYQDGVGACPLQTDKDKGAIDFNFIKSDAVMKAAPAAESYAIKDAAEKLGKLFGKDLNRKDVIDYDILANAIPPDKKAINDAIQKIIKGLDEFKGDNKEELKDMCREKMAAGEFTMVFAEQIAKSIGITL